MEHHRPARQHRDFNNHGFLGLGYTEGIGKDPARDGATGLNIDLIIKDLKQKFPQIKQLEHAHLWTITADMLVFSAHMLLHDEQQAAVQQNLLIAEINEYLQKKYHIIESTIQILCEGDAGTCPLSPDSEKA